MKKAIITCSILLFTTLVLTSCTNYGKEKDFKGVQLFYTSSVTESEADMLGNYLIKTEFADGKEKTVQLNRKENTYQFRMVVKKGLEQDTAYGKLANDFASELSTKLFKGNQVEVHLCDEHLKTLKVFSGNN